MTGEGYVLVGGGIAAATTAATLRRRGFDGAIVVVAAEPEPPYQRPPLSKGLLVGTSQATDIRARPPEWYAEQNVELRLGVRATDIDPAAHSVSLSSGDRLRYDALVLATGLRPRRLPGFAGERVHYLRTLADARALREQLDRAERLVVLGAGFVGSEVAASAVALGKQVTIFEPAPAPLAAVLGTEMGGVLMEIHREHGVVVRLGEHVTDVTDTGTGLVLTSSRGDQVECDLVLVAVGSIPNIELAESAGLATGNGITVDEYGATSAPDVYAVGDVASRHHPAYGEPVRVEHHDNAIRQGVNLAANLTGTPTPYAEAHWFWSDQYEHTLQSVGRPRNLDALIVRGSPGERSFSAFSLTDGTIDAVISLNRPGDVLAVRRMLFTPHEVTEQQLRDESTPLKQLIPRPAART
jgi:3-phenylpropionate/trans-cinnamate dioxygenase ferredoxin reductase component